MWSHAAWSENFPWTRLAGVAMPAEAKQRVPSAGPLAPDAVRELAGDGSYGGLYQRPDEDVLQLWNTGVEEVRALLADGWR